MKLSHAMRFLEKKTGSYISLHILHPAFLDCEALSLEPDQYLHHGDFCRCMKMHGDFGACSGNKARSLKRASSGLPFSGRCPFGVWEYAEPVITEGHLIAVIYLGYFLKRNDVLRGAPSVWKGKEPPVLTPETESALQKAGAFLRDFILLEIENWRTSCAMNGKHALPEHYLKTTQFFIDCHFSENIGLENMADTLNVTPNYLGELIRKQTGKTFRRLLTERRMREACVYLKLHRYLSVSRIALLCGFQDSNYFATVFHRELGMTPREYRVQDHGK